jgi:pimeloyl-ACP methyl ester carboxylesterase
MQESQPPATLSPRRRSWRRSATRILSILLVLYILGGFGLYFGQGFLMFPGAFVHDRQQAVVPPGPDREIITLHDVGDHQISAVYGVAEDARGNPLPDAKSRPTLLFLYGNGDCAATSMGLFREFRRLGVNVIIPEYLGYPMSSGKPSEQGCYDTADAAYSYLVDHKSVDPSQIIVVGRSIGSGPAIDLAMRKTVAGVATFSGFTSMDEMAQKVVPWYPTNLLCTCHFQNLGKIAEVKCPVFLAHGTKDDFVPYSMMGRLAAQVKSPLSVVPVDGADHNNIFGVGGIELMQKFGKFIDSVHQSHLPVAAH